MSARNPSTCSCHRCKVATPPPAYPVGEPVRVLVFGSVQPGTIKGHTADGDYIVADSAGMTAIFHESELGDRDPADLPDAVWTE